MKKSVSNNRFGNFFTMALLLSSFSLSAQTGSITGSCLASYEPLEGALVQLNDNSGVIAETYTDARGDYAFNNIPYGDYSINLTEVNSQNLVLKALSDGDTTNDGDANDLDTTPDNNIDVTLDSSDKNGVDSDNLFTTLVEVESDGSDSSFPVELITFDAEQSGSEVLLSWATATELNNKGFYVERSTDGVSFEVIDFVEGQGNSSEIVEYSFVDASPLSGDNFYRLVQEDFDGAQVTGSIISLSVFFNIEAAVYPNPLTGSVLNVAITAEANTKAVVEVFSFDGKLAKTITQDVVAGDNRLEIDMSDVNSGMYLVKVVAGTQTITEKLIKQ